MSRRTLQPWQIIAAIATGLIIWAVVIIWGVVRNQTALDPGKPIFIGSVVGAFLLLWSLLLWYRSRSQS